MKLPDYVVHYDWSTHPRKRAFVKAERRGEAYYLQYPRAVRGELTDVLDPFTHSGRRQPDATLFVGIDVPIGVPLAYAVGAGIHSFVELLPQLGSGEWIDFYLPAEQPEEIGLRRPFYPLRPGNSRQQHLLRGLGVAHIDQLRRLCELPTAYRRAAAPLFWTMGAQQVGKAAISVWRDVLAPALRDVGRDIALWPFDGPLNQLLEDHRIVVAEAYPAEFYHHLGVQFPRTRGQKSGKRVSAARQANAETLLTWITSNPVTLEPTFEQLIHEGFGPHPTGEDRFDATIGVMGMLNILFGRRSPGEPDEAIRAIEGNILGIGRISP